MMSLAPVVSSHRGLFWLVVRHPLRGRRLPLSEILSLYSASDSKPNSLLISLACCRISEDFETNTQLKDLTHTLLGVSGITRNSTTPQHNHLGTMQIIDVHTPSSSFSVAHSRTYWFCYHLSHLFVRASLIRRELMTTL